MSNKKICTTVSAYTVFRTRHRILFCLYKVCAYRLICSVKPQDAFGTALSFSQCSQSVVVWGRVSKAAVAVSQIVSFVMFLSSQRRGCQGTVSDERLVLSCHTPNFLWPRFPPWQLFPWRWRRRWGCGIGRGSGGERV